MTLTQTRPAALPTPSNGEVAPPRPASVTAGAALAIVLSVASIAGLITFFVRLTHDRYSNDHSRFDYPAPVYGVITVALLVLLVGAVVGILAAVRTLAWSGVARIRLVGFGFVAAVVDLVAMLRGFNVGHHPTAWVSLVFLVLTVVSLVLLSTHAADAWMDARSPWAHLWRWVRGNLVLFFGLLVLAYLYIPNLVVAAMSFNLAPGKRTVYTWHEFTWSTWGQLCKPEGMCQSVVTSLWIGAVATIIATIIGTLAAFGLVRHRFVGRSSGNVVLFLPMATPEIVMGSSLLAFFVALRLGGHLGHTTIIVAHVMFCLSYVVTTVKARLAGMDRTLEQAAMDLYATESQTFWRITFPLVFPGILAAALLSFSLSFDDYIVTNLNAGQVTTFPMYVWGAAQRGLPMQVNAVGTAMFALAIAVVVGADLINRGRARAARTR